MRFGSLSSAAIVFGSIRFGSCASAVCLRQFRFGSLSSAAIRFGSFALAAIRFGSFLLIALMDVTLGVPGPGPSSQGR
eukprot:9340648-Karenia_brevis.AAC.1